VTAEEGAKEVRVEVAAMQREAQRHAGAGSEKARLHAQVCLHAARRRADSRQYHCSAGGGGQRGVGSAVGAGIRFIAAPRHAARQRVVLFSDINAAAWYGQHGSSLASPASI